MSDDLVFTRVIPVEKLRGCYLLWNNGCVVYVGQSENIMQRIGVHMANPKKEFDGYSYTVVDNGDLNDLEAELIARYKPTLNNEMPVNRKYKSVSQIKKMRKMSGWEWRRERDNYTPVWHDYYNIYEIIQHQNAIARGEL